MSTLIIVPARGGSKSIPLKNIRFFAGKHLIGWTIECGLKSGVAQAVLLSTDNEEISDIGKRYGAMVPFLRPSSLAKDETATAPVIKHALLKYENATRRSVDYVLILEPTAPARKPEHVRDALTILRETKADSVSGVSEVPHHYASSKILKKNSDGFIRSLSGLSIADMKHRRQDLEKEYAFNGIVWGCRAELLRQKNPNIWGEKNLGLVIDPKYSLDLDTSLDWEIGELRMVKIKKELS